MGSILVRACRPSRSEFSMIFFETRVNVGYDPLERPPLTDGIPPVGPHTDNWSYPYTVPT